MYKLLLFKYFEGLILVFFNIFIYFFYNRLILYKNGNNYLIFLVEVVNYKLINEDK